MNELEYFIKEEILSSGPITFADFMQHALYHPELGYYSTGDLKIGKNGDFYTSPHVSSAFGEVIGIFIEKAINYLEITDFTILELGAGKGFLALDILNYLSGKPELYDLINYIIIDNNVINTYIDKLEIHKEKTIILNNINELDCKLKGVVISNELFDSLPFHRIKYLDNKFREIYVNYENNGFNEITRGLSSERIMDYLNNYDLNLTDSKQIEVNLLAKEILKDISFILDSGFILTIDYGHLSDNYFDNERIDGTFRCFYRHTVNDNPYINIGDQDITADVDFTNLIESGTQFFSTIDFGN